MMRELSQRLEHIPDANCRCFIPPLHYMNYEEVTLGVDKTNGRYADVSLFTCLHCTTKWLHYYAEYEAYSRSGRWYRGIISDKEAKEITPESAVAYLERLDWYIFGGSWFSSQGMYGKGKVRADL